MATKALEAQAEKEFEEKLKREREEADQALVRGKRENSLHVTWFLFVI